MMMSRMGDPTQWSLLVGSRADVRHMCGACHVRRMSCASCMCGGVLPRMCRIWLGCMCGCGVLCSVLLLLREKSFVGSFASVMSDVVSADRRVGVYREAT